jgi:hypothetical protein
LPSAGELGSAYTRAPTQRKITEVHPALPIARRGTPEKSQYFLNKSAIYGSTIGKDSEIFNQHFIRKGFIRHVETNQSTQHPTGSAGRTGAPQHATTTSPVSEPPATPRPLSSSTADQATIGKSSRH